jgi:hypothetical protein
VNQAELHDALSDLAGPPPPATPRARAAVTRRVTRARRRIGAVSAAAVVVVAAVGVGVAQSSALDGGGGERVVAGRAPSCRRLPRPVPRAQVPAEVRAWAKGAPVVGEGSLWTARRVLRNGFVRIGEARRFKFGWLVVPAGPDATPPRLTARAVDGPGRATGEADLGLDDDGYFFASGIEVTGPSRCWAITVRHGDDAITFRRAAGPRP